MISQAAGRIKAFGTSFASFKNQWALGLPFLLYLPYTVLPHANMSNLTLLTTEQDRIYKPS